ncbi:hypothetical protein BDB00DRAFT_946353 [Zychaea mexicana]|uniref:uncharacterized protein n=1 Tax=Zychaea mexicana TaxID=64656 RepID=UPI0022FE9451|nr:uncharacterized protein BDB00DRAFT_946353 [Zychaea mexicana]KAI9492431.1 hypothetical protein BDB00DRAFT_946353 [Zychaea mexicana]
MGLGKKYSNNDAAKHLPPVDLHIDEAPVYFIGPATADNPMSHVRTRLMGSVSFNDPKLKWNRITLQFSGKAGLDIQAPVSALPRELAGDDAGNSSSKNTMRLDSTMSLCKIEKELIFTGEKVIEFGLHLPTTLPPSIRAKHAFVEYTLVANFSAGTFFKKYRIQKSVALCRHYLPSPSAMIPCIEYNNAREWFEWSAEVPKAVAIEAGEVVIALRWSVEKELVEVDQIELALEEIETYRFSTKSGVHNLPPMISRFPATTYHPPSHSGNSETHFIRTPLPINTPVHKVARPVRTHIFNPFLDISHRLRLVIHFTTSPSLRPEPVVLEYPIIVTDYPADQPSISPVVGGDEAVCVDLDLPEYTPRYEQLKQAGRKEGREKEKNDGASQEAAGTSGNRYVVRRVMVRSRFK